MKMSMEHWWNDTDKGKARHLAKNLIPCQLSTKNLNIDWPGIEPGPPRWEASN